MVEQTPISYLNQLYDGNLGVLWMDAHPDVTTPKEFHHEHAMVLGNLLGEGDPVFAAKVPVKLNPKKVMFGGLQKTTKQETEVIQRLGMRHASPADLAHDSSAILDWIKEEKSRNYLFILILMSWMQVYLDHCYSQTLPKIPVLFIIFLRVK
ncbi:Arginase/agmatinase family enzyme (SpeB) (PDB:1CEV) [Commensalibacter communis]|nr:Arginase/agmatinase family enzyme (SpeB) (PDB:1CEV) [Commensalibacter communis]CAI3945888.1 Arginase/agmatinase family enzyme (SpeB) (PDB:1CEV) [Commensalibacter communis]